MRAIVFSHAGGRLGFAEIVEQAAFRAGEDGEPVAMSDAEILADFIARGFLPDGAGDAAVAEIAPSSRLFRDAWRLDAGAVVVDLPAARDIHLARLRLARDAALEASDGPFLRALEAGDAEALEGLRTRRQALRDLPESVAAELQAAESADAIAALRPAVLDEPG